MLVVRRSIPYLLGLVLLGGCAGKTTHENAAPADPAGGSAGSFAGGAGSSAGGTESTGGMSSAGGGGSPTAGASGTAGDTSAAGTGGSGGAMVVPTAGCGKDPGQPLGEYQRYLVPLSGETLGAPHQHTEREILVRLPLGYDNTKPYRVVYITVHCGGEASSAYPLWDDVQGGDPDAIYVALGLPDPPPSPPSLAECTDNRSGIDSIEWESLDHDHAFVSERFCVDNDRVYHGGYECSGSISDMYSCYFGGTPEPPRKFLPNVALRGAMAVSGCGVGEYPACNGPVARLWIHDEADVDPNGFACAQAERDQALAQNGCSGGPDGPTEPWGEDFITDGSCLKYTACPAQYPVVFCATLGRGHSNQPDNALPAFTRFVQEIEAAGP